jgi:dihydroneopterin aldolase
VSERSDRDLIELRGLRVVTLVGALPEEHERAQPLELDVDVEADLSVAGASDVLTDTIDYGALCDVVELTILEGGHVRLLEALADRVAAAVLATDERITGVTLVVRKLRPPVPQDLATSGVRITRRR